MLYTYKYSYNHKIHDLNKHLLIFFRKIRDVPKSARFLPKKYFHSDFIKVIKGTLLEVKFREFFNHFKTLGTHQKEEFYIIVRDSQSIDRLLEDIKIDCNPYSKDGLKLILNNVTPLMNLMSALYCSLSSKNGRYDIYDHYEEIYKKAESKICPFCGVETLHRYHREDYDHLAPKSIYPLFTVNMRNLAPMCTQCNEKIKLNQDVFYKDDDKNIRRPFAYPYKTKIEVNLDFNNSIIPQTDINDPEGKWFIKFMPENELVITWKDVFEIEKRYIVDFIDGFYKDWITYFLNQYDRNINNEDDLKKLLKEYSDILYKQPLHEKNIIKAPLFKYLSECDNSYFYSSLLTRIKKKLIA